MLDKLLKDLEAAQKGMDDKRASLSALVDSKSAKPEDVTAADAAFKTAREAVEKLTEQVEKAVEEAKSAERTAAATKAAREMTVVDVQGKALVAAVAVDHQKEDQAELDIFARYCSKGRAGLSPLEIERVKPSVDSAFKSEDAQMGIRMPRRLVSKILGPVFSKAVPMLSTANADGGYTFQSEFRAMLLQLASEGPTLMPRVTTIPTRSGTVLIPRLNSSDANEFGGVAVGWTAEGGQKPETQPTFEQVSITAAELSAYTEVSHRLLSRSALDLETILAALFRGSIYDAVENAMVNGSGVAQPLGVVNTAGIHVVGRQQAGQVNWQDLVKLKYALKPYHRRNAFFVVNDDVARDLELKVDSQNRPLFTASTANGIYDRLVGFPWVTNTRLPALGMEGDIIFMDPVQYYLVMEEDVVVKRSDDFKFRNNLAAFAVFIAVGGQDVQPRTVSVLSGPNS